MSDDEKTIVIGPDSKIPAWPEDGSVLTKEEHARRQVEREQKWMERMKWPHGGVETYPPGATLGPDEKGEMRVLTFPEGVDEFEVSGEFRPDAVSSAIFQGASHLINMVMDDLCNQPTMTVAELISALQAKPPGAKVYSESYDCLNHILSVDLNADGSVRLSGCEDDDSGEEAENTGARTMYPYEQHLARQQRERR